MLSTAWHTVIHATLIVFTIVDRQPFLRLAVERANLLLSRVTRTLKVLRCIWVISWGVILPVFQKAVRANKDSAVTVSVHY